jgi:hypothetical protein
VTSLAQRLVWEKHERTLKRALANLRDGGWIEYDVRAGQRRPYVVVLTGLRLNDDPRDDDIRF